MDAEFIHQKNIISAETVSEFVSEESRREQIKQIVTDVLVEMQKEDNINVVSESRWRENKNYAI